MKGRSKRIVAMLAVATIMVGQCSSVLAEEVTEVTTEVIRASEIGIEEPSLEENATQSDETESVVETDEVAETELVAETDEVVETDEFVDSEAVVETEVSEETVAVTEMATEISTEAVVENLADVPMLLAEEGSTEETTETETTVEVLPVTNVSWYGDGSIEFRNPNTERVHITFELRFNGEKHNSPDTHLPPYAETGGPNYAMFGDYGIKKTGDYTVTIKVFPENMDFFEDVRKVYSDWEIETTSPVYSYTYPGVELSTVSNVNYSSTGIVTWDAVDDEYVDFYSVALYDVTEGNSDTESSFVASESVNAGEECKADFLDYITEKKDYEIRIRVFSSDIREIYHSEQIAVALEINDEGIVEEVNDTLTGVTENLSENSSADEVTAAVTNVKSAFADTQEKRELQLAMQTNSDTRAEIEKLEALYEDAMQVNTDISVAEDMGIDSSKVSILGASLNASQAGEVSFDMSVPTDERMEELFGEGSNRLKSICFSMDLTGAGVTPGNLEIPVTITMPVPNGINPDWACVSHYRLDGTEEEVAVRNNGDGTISFTITHFSEFEFYEVEKTSSNTSTNSSSSSSKKKVVEKPWVPTTPDEKERYSYFGREKLNYIVGTEGGYKAELVNMMQGRLFFDSVEAAMGDYSIARTYNVEIDGKLVYETAMPAMFVMNIPEAYLAAGRDYKMVCISKGGEVTILDDLDTAPETITFLTNKFYAFALIYKDTIVTE